MRKIIGIILVLCMSVGMGYSSDNDPATNDVTLEMSQDNSNHDASGTNLVSAKIPCLIECAYISTERVSPIAKIAEEVEISLIVYSNSVTYLINKGNLTTDKINELMLTDNRTKFIDLHRLN